MNQANSRGIGSRGESSNGTEATAATNFAPNMMRLLRFRYRRQFDWAVAVCILGCVLAIYGFQGGSGLATILGVLLIVAGGAVLGYLFYLGRMFSAFYKNGLLTAAVVLDKDGGVTLTHITSLRKNFSTPAVYGVKHVTYNRFPPCEIGDRIPCVSSFQDGDWDERWSDFFSMPVLFGTSSAEKIQTCLDYLESDVEPHGNLFDLLRRCIRKQPLLDRAVVYHCDADGMLLATQPSVLK